MNAFKYWNLSNEKLFMFIIVMVVGILTRGNAANLAGEYPFELVKILPYIAVLVAALSGAHVLIVLVGGTIFVSVVGLLDGSYHLSSLLEAVAEGVMGIVDLAIVSILIGGIVGIIQHKGGIDYLLHIITSKIKTKKGADFGILPYGAQLLAANSSVSILFYSFYPVLMGISSLIAILIGYPKFRQIVRFHLL